MKRGQCSYMTGLTDAEFHCLFDCIEPFLHVSKLFSIPSL